VFTNLKEEFILCIDFFQTVGLGYDPSSRELYWMDKSDSTWSAANLQYSEKITIEPTTNKVVTLNVITRRNFRDAEQCEAIAAISSEKYIVKGG
jgi:hypothetical protein